MADLRILKALHRERARNADKLRRSRVRSMPGCSSSNAHRRMSYRRQRQSIVRKPAIASLNIARDDISRCGVDVAVIAAYANSWRSDSLSPIAAPPIREFQADAS